MVDDLGANDDDDNLPEDLLAGGEEELTFDYPNEEDKDDEEEEDEDEVQVLNQSSKSTSEGLVPFDPEIHDITGYEKADIIRLRNSAFKDDMKYGKKVKGVLLGLPSGSIPTIQQINSSELFTLRAPQKGKSENDDDDEEGPPKEADIHCLWLPFLQGNKALGNCPPLQFDPPGNWPKVYTTEGLQNHFPMGVTVWKPRQPLPSLIIIVPPDSPPLEKGHFLDHLHSHKALQRYSLGTGKLRKQFAFCPYCGIRSENQVSAYSHARQHHNIAFLCEACAKFHTRSYVQMNKHLTECRAISSEPQRGQPLGKKAAARAQPVHAAQPSGAASRTQRSSKVTTKQRKGSR